MKISTPLTVLKTNEWPRKVFLVAVILVWFLYFSIMFEIVSWLLSKGVDKPLYSGIFKFTTISVNFSKVFQSFCYFFISCNKILISLIHVPQCVFLFLSYCYICEKVLAVFWKAIFSIKCSFSFSQELFSSRVTLLCV